MSEKIRVYSNAPPNDDWVRDVCLIGKGHKCCRYLTIGANGWSCEKHHPYLREVLDRRVANRSMVARGDNCTGKKSV